MLLFPGGAEHIGRKGGGGAKKSTTHEENAALVQAYRSIARTYSGKRQTIILVGETAHYRTAARFCSTASDSALEIGCAYGDCVAILQKKTGNAWGVDKSKAAVAQAVSRYPELAGRTEVLDIFVQKRRLAELCVGRDLVVT